MTSIESYIPGGGYKEGYNDRMNGLADRSITHATTEPFWMEYRQGYMQAEKNIIEKARQEVNESRRFLAE